jgi:prepilin-type N-terminal cleavage/methylation domain-containing protein
VQGSKINKAGGITLLELMVVIVIIGILVAVAIPNMAGWFGKKDLDSVARGMFSHFQLARSQAIRDGIPVQIRINVDHDWYDVHVSDSNGAVIVPQTNMPRGIDIMSSTFPLSATANTTGFSPRGFATTAQGEVRIRSTAAPTSSNVRVIELTPGGTVRIQSSHE